MPQYIYTTAVVTLILICLYLCIFLVNDHEIVYPAVHFTNHERFKRYSETDRKEKHRSMNVRFNALGKKFNLDLKLNKRLLSPNFHIETLGNEGKIIHRHTIENCFYSGHLKNENGSLVSVSNCNGLVSRSVVYF